MLQRGRNQLEMMTASRWAKKPKTVFICILSCGDVANQRRQEKNHAHTDVGTRGRGSGDQLMRSRSGYAEQYATFDPSLACFLCGCFICTHQRIKNSVLTNKMHLQTYRNWFLYFFMFMRFQHFNAQQDDNAGVFLGGRHDANLLFFFICR